MATGRVLGAVARASRQVAVSTASNLALYDLAVAGRASGQWLPVLSALFRAARRRRRRILHERGGMWWRACICAEKQSTARHRVHGVALQHAASFSRARQEAGKADSFREPDSSPSSRTCWYRWNNAVSSRFRCSGRDTQIAHGYRALPAQRVSQPQPPGPGCRSQRLDPRERRRGHFVALSLYRSCGGFSADDACDLFVSYPSPDRPTCRSGSSSR